MSENLRGNWSPVVLSSCKKGSYFEVLTECLSTLSLCARMHQRKQKSSLTFWILWCPLFYRDLGVSMNDPAPILGRNGLRLIARLCTESNRQPLPTDGKLATWLNKISKNSFESYAVTSAMISGLVRKVAVVCSSPWILSRTKLIWTVTYYRMVLETLKKCTWYLKKWKLDFVKVTQMPGSWRVKINTNINTNSESR